MSLHPDFTRFSVAFKQARHQDALDLIDALIAAHPQAGNGGTNGLQTTTKAPDGLVTQARSIP